jgi:uncharacterized protein (TIGR02588 family)
MSETDHGTESPPHNEPRTLAEWVSLIVSALLVAALISMILIFWVQDRGRPATFHVEQGIVRKAGTQYYLPFSVTNKGDRTGANVVVEGKLTEQAGRTVSDNQRSTTVFDFIPAQASAEGIFVFTAEPSGADLRVTSYQPP